MKTNYQHPTLGEITVNHSARARRVSVSVRPSGVTLTVPRRCSLAEALAFAESKQSWIERAKTRAETRQAPPRILLPPFRTRLHELSLQAGSRPGFRICNGGVSVMFPEDWSPQGEEAQSLIKKAVTEALRIEAKQLLPERVAALSHRTGLVCAGLSFRNAVSRWGSCSARNTISLSIHLMLLPDELIDYVILHELCHTKHKNHGPKFHALLDKVTNGRHRELDKLLKNYTPRW